MTAKRKPATRWEITDGQFLSALRRERNAALEEAAALARDPYGKEVCALGCDEPREVGIKTARAIRRLKEKTP